jgi:predicted protein tyrosine phosphatase
MTLIVCSLADMPEVVRRRTPSHLLTLIDPSTPVERPHGLVASRHLRLDFFDIVEPSEGFPAPDMDSIIRLLDFSRGWDASAPMVVHCFAGISRSTASAYATVCALNPHRDERHIAQALRRASPTATPNPRIVSIADRLLDRQGRMVDAVENIGRGVMADEATPFRLDLE